MADTQTNFSFLCTTILTCDATQKTKEHRENTSKHTSFQYLLYTCLHAMHPFVAKMFISLLSTTAFLCRPETKQHHTTPHSLHKTITTRTYSLVTVPSKPRAEEFISYFKPLTFIHSLLTSLKNSNLASKSKKTNHTMPSKIQQDENLYFLYICLQNSDLKIVRPLSISHTPYFSNNIILSCHSSTSQSVLWEIEREADQTIRSILPP